MTRFLHSLAFRLTLWYAGLIGLFFVAIFAISYAMMRHNVNAWTQGEINREKTEVAIAHKDGGISGVVRQLMLEEAAEGGRFMGRLINPQGIVAYETGPGQWARTPIKEEAVREARSGKEVTDSVELDKHHKVQVLYTPLPDGSVLEIGLTHFNREDWISRFGQNLLKVNLLILLASMVAGAFMARRALFPILRMARTAGAISARTPGQRVSAPDHSDEVDQLANAYNQMLERIDILVQGLHEVTDALANDIRTPLSGIRETAAAALHSNREPDEYRLVLSRIIQEVDCLLALSNAIVEGAAAEYGALSLDVETVSLGDLAKKIVETLQPVALDKGVALETAVPEGLKLKCDQARLGQAFSTLLHNAVMRTPTGGYIRLLVEQPVARHNVVVAVTDTGIGIAQEDLPHIFEHCHREDKTHPESRVRHGLPLVQGIVKAHGGQVSVESKPGKGTIFRVSLPFNTDE